MNGYQSLLGTITLLSISLFSYNVTAQEPGDASAPPAAIATGEHVTRAVFTSSVQGREPTDTITTLGNDKNQIFFFSELSGLAGQTVVHRWEYQGKVMAEIKFNVGAPHWRVWSSKSLLPQWTGKWRVFIIDGAGNKMGETSFNYTSANASQN